MSFTSGSALARPRKEFVFAGPSRSIASEYVELRSTRFDRKAFPKGTKGTMTEEVVICQYRGESADSADNYPISLSSIPFDDIRSFHNLEATPYGFEEDHDVVQWLCAMAGESPTLRALLKDAQIEGWNIRLDDIAGNGFEIDDEECTIALDHYGFTAQALGRSGHFRNEIFVNFTRALRTLWHDRQNYNFENTHNPEAALLLQRAQAADCESIVILAGWELRGAGHPDVWRFILGSEQGDMAMIFTRAMEKDPAGFYDGSVLARTFCQWYGDETRVSEFDQTALEDMDAYLQEGGKFGTHTLSAQSIEMITQLPGGMAYMAGMGENMCTDPYFVSLHDMINEAHLFQIIYDSKVVMVEGVPFRDDALARKIFPLELVTLKD
jgi:hypothetical protein